MVHAGHKNRLLKEVLQIDLQDTEYKEHESRQVLKT